MNLKLLWYCTKVKGKNYYLRKMPNGRYCLSRDKGESLNGKIVAESDYEVEKIIHTYDNGTSVSHRYKTKTLDNEQLLRKSHIIGKAIDEYLGERQYDKNNNVVGYAIHIKNLNVFNKPKKLGMAYYMTLKSAKKIQKAPQNMCIVRSYYLKNYFEKYILISVRPEWLCLILNGLKDVELRRKVLKEML